MNGFLLLNSSPSSTLTQGLSIGVNVSEASAGLSHDLNEAQRPHRIITQY